MVTIHSNPEEKKQSSDEEATSTFTEEQENLGGEAYSKLNKNLHFSKMVAASVSNLCHSNKRDL